MPRHYDRTTLPAITQTEHIMASRQYRQVASFPLPGQYTVALWQNRGGFAVTYGLQLAAQLPYDKACQELGECLMHQASCAGAIQEN